MSSSSDTSFFLFFFFLLSLSRLCLSSVVRDALASVMSRAALLPAEDSRALATPLTLSLSLSLSQRKLLCDSSQRTLSEPNTASPAPGGERERAGMGWKEGRGQHGKRGEETPPNKEERDLPRVQRPRNSFSRCPPPGRFLLVFWGGGFLINV